MKAKIKHNEFFGVLAFWEFCLMFALHDRGYSAGKIKQGMRAIDEQMTRFDEYSRSKSYTNDAHNRDEAIFLFEWECSFKSIDWKRIRELSEKSLPVLRSDEYKVRRDKAYWDMIAGYALAKTYGMKTDTIICVLMSQRRHLDNIQHKVGSTPKYIKLSKIPTADIVEECIFEANRRGIDWQEALDVVIHINGETMSGTSAPATKGCYPYAQAPIDMAGFSAVGITRKGLFDGKQG